MYLKFLYQKCFQKNEWDILVPDYIVIFSYIHVHNASKLPLTLREQYSPGMLYVCHVYYSFQ